MSNPSIKFLHAWACVFALAISLQSGGARADSTVQVDFAANPNVQDWARGRYVYQETKTGKWRGEEEWMLTHNADGSRTLRMFTLISATELMRDFTHRVDANFRPLESFQATWRKGQRTGAGFYTFHDDRVEATVFSPNGVFTQRADVTGPVTMITHSMAGDGWHFGSYDRTRGGEQQVTAFNPSGWGDGIQSVLAKVYPVEIMFKGTETITVPAGRFETEVWLIGKNADGVWRNEVWLHGPHKIMVKFIEHPHGLTYLLDGIEQPKK